jgi:hypothetical protein
MRALALTAALFVAACSGSAGSTLAPGAPPTRVPGSPASAAVALLTWTGTGVGATSPFAASGDHVTLTYHYGSCDTGVKGDVPIANNAMRIAEAVEFVVSIVGAQAAGPNLEVPVVSGVVALSGTRTLPVYLNGQPGPFHFTVTSTCQWSLTVTGQP